MDFDALKNAFISLKSDPALLIASNLQVRADALDTLTYIDEVILHNPGKLELSELAFEVRQLHYLLESINIQVFSEVRDLMKSPETTKSSLRILFDTYTSYKSGDCNHIHVDYEALDVLIAGTLFPFQAPVPEMVLPPEMVQWEASPGSVILDLLDHVALNPDDVLYDLGSGLGNVAIIINLLSGIQTIGIERDPAYCLYAQNLANEFNLDSVSFINTDARDADFNDGTVFYLFTPFMASVLHAVMEKIHRVSQNHPIHVCSFGPCTPEIASLSWLHNTNGDSQHEFKLAIFKAGESAF